MKIDIAAKQIKSYETEEEGIFTKANENSLGQIQNLADAAYGAAGRTFSNEEFSLKEEPEITLVTKKSTDSNELHRSKTDRPKIPKNNSDSNLTDSKSDSSKPTSLSVADRMSFIIKRRQNELAKSKSKT